MRKKGNSHEISKPKSIWKCSNLGWKGRVSTLDLRLTTQTLIVINLFESNHWTIPFVRSILNSNISAPKIIIYDNCCHLHNYCLNRDPEFFKHTKFLIDRFHWKNHTGMIFTLGYEKMTFQLKWQKFEKKSKIFFLLNLCMIRYRIPFVA